MSTPTKVAPQSKPESTFAKRSIAPARSVLLQKKCACGPGSNSGECEACEKREREQRQKEEKKGQAVQRSASGRAPAAATAPPVVNSVLNSPGRSLDASTRSLMEPRFGQDFSNVRVHTGAQAAESARAVNAHAYTVGQDIVFDHGKYDPGSHSGRQLLAHELAHTVQQHGLQRSADGISLGESGEYHRLEREADTAAQAVMSGSSVPALEARPSRSLVSRAAKDDDDKKSTAASKTPSKAADGRNWVDVDGSSPLGQAGVKQRAKAPQGVSQDIQAFNVGNLDLPAEKGNVLSTWKSVAASGALQAIVESTGESKTKLGLKQERPKTDKLRDIWLEKVKWKSQDEESNWKKAATKNDTFRPTTANKNQCHVDHILELQFGGDNISSNMQMLDGPENVKSGRDIFQMLADQAGRVRTALQREGQTPTDVLLYYESVTQTGAICKDCCAAEAKAATIGGVGAGESVAGEKGVEYPVSAGGRSATFLITGDLIKDVKKPVPLKDSAVPENRSGATIIAGFELDKLHRGSTPGKDTISAVIDSESKTKLPVSMVGEKGVDLHVAKDGKLTLPPGRANLKFHYPYLSDGAFSKLDLQEDGTLSGEGTIKPSISFLPQLGIRFDKDSFVVTTPDLTKKLKPPIPGFQFTKGELGLVLAPEFKPYGELAFEYKRGAKVLIDGSLTVTADAQGLLAQGKVNAHIPGIDKAEGNITFQNNVFSGGVTIEATQLKSKFKYVNSGKAMVGFKGKEVFAEGSVNLAIPGTEGVDVGLFYEKNKWLFKGTGKFKPPRLEETEIHIEYDGEHISGYGSTGFKLYGFNGTITVNYYDDKFSGKGDVNFKKGKATGKLHVEMTPEHKFFGSGEVTYQITENLIGTAGIDIDKNEKVRLKGALEFPKPIHIFDPIKGDYDIFSIGVSIPIPGLSIPGIGGVNARIEGALSAGYRIGPGEIRDVKAKAEFDPFEDKPDVDILLTGNFYIGMNAHVTGKIRGGIEVSIAIASLAGGLEITATASLDGHVLSEVEMHYQQSRFEAKANFDVLLKLILTLGIDAWIRAKAGYGWLSVESEKVWNLASFTYDPGLQLGMKLKKPVRYASDEGFQFPSLSDIEWITPKISASDVLGKLFGAQNPEPKALQ